MNSDDRIFEQTKEGNRSILQDYMGYIWLGSDNGLVQYNGYEFIEYTSDKDNEKTLNGNGIWEIFEDSKHQLWICTNNGLSLFNRALKNFTRFYPDAENKDGDKIFIHSVDEDSSGKLWLLTKDGIILFDPQKKKFTDYTDSIKTSPPGTFAYRSNWYKFYFYEDTQKNIWIAAHNGLYVYSQEKKVFTHFVHDDSNPNSLSCNKTMCIKQDKTGNIWISTLGGGLNCIRAANLMPKGEVYKANQKFVHYKKSETDTNSVISDYTTKVYFDSHDNLWIGGLNGFSKYNPNKDNFSSYYIMFST